MPYTVQIGSHKADECHSEMNVKSVDEAIEYLHAFARKAKPEPAVANIGDFRAWTSNKGFENIDLARINQKLAEKVAKRVRYENETDRQAELDVNQHCPDIKITPISEGVVMVYSFAMNCEYPVGVDNLAKTVAELITEYQDLVAAGEVSEPKY